MEIKKLKVKDLKYAPYNPHKMSDEMLEKLKRSIKEFGYVEPIIVNQRNMQVVGGNQRLKVLKDLGVEEAEAVIVDLDDAKEKTLNIALTKIIGEWDYPKLKDLLEELDTGEIDIELTGFDMGEIEELMTQFPTEGKEDDFDVDKAIEEAKEPICKTGDIWQLGRHRLMCGDATKKEDVERLMDGKRADMIFTDPPYNVDYGISKKPCHNIRTIRNDKQTSRQWYDFCNAINIILKEYNNGDIYLWGAPGPEGMRQRLWLTEAGCHWSATIIWKKQQLVLTPANYQRMYEPCFYGWFNKSSYNGDRTQTEVWEIDRPLKSNLHPTMKPIELSDKAINNSSKINDIVLDLFGGSGSTLISCEKINRICYMMEIEPVYCDVIIKRWEDYTGQKAMKL